MRKIKFRFWEENHYSMRTWGQSYNSDNLKFLFADDDIVPMQYTGIKDKNGQEIYEGDIVKCTYNSGMNFVGEVIFDEAMYFLKNDDEYSILTTQYEGETLEILGNIYENPELLVSHFDESAH